MLERLDEQVRRTSPQMTAPVGSTDFSIESAYLDVLVRCFTLLGSFSGWRGRLEACAAGPWHFTGAFQDLSCFGVAQGVSLVLSSCAALKHQPGKGTLACLSAAMRRALPAFNRNELASCLEAFKAFNYHPGNELLQVGSSTQVSSPVPICRLSCL